MYEEHAAAKLKDDNATQVLERSPKEFVELLYNKERSNTSNDKHHTYWTSPMNDIAPGLLNMVPNYESLHDDTDDSSPRQPKAQLDPRGPSLWMGSSGSATQAHYDVADNVIVQLFGSKRIRCYAPEQAAELYVFPDAHPRARKSQVNFDQPDYERFPQFASLSDPVIDVVLQPGDAIRIPAFWFHHVENGRLPNSDSMDDLHSLIGADEPSVSLNVFALSKSMMVAQGIFRDASRPFGFLAAANNDEQYQFSVAALHALGWGLFEGLGLQGTPRAYIQTHLFDRRYTPLGIPTTRNSNGNSSITGTTKPLTASEQEFVSLCIARLLPQFETLNDGISSLVFCHLLELWAVELVGASSVADAWEAVLLLDDQQSV